MTEVAKGVTETRLGITGWYELSADVDKSADADVNKSADADVDKSADADVEIDLI